MIVSENKHLWWHPDGEPAFLTGDPTGTMVDRDELERMLGQTLEGMSSGLSEEWPPHVTQLTSINIQLRCLLWEDCHDTLPYIPRMDGSFCCLFLLSLSSL